MKFGDGRIYRGHWFMGEPHGFGLFTWPNGQRYEGEYLHGQK